MYCSVLYAEIALPYAEEFPIQLGSEIILASVNEPTKDAHEATDLITRYLQKTARSMEEKIAGCSCKLGTTLTQNVKLAVLAGHPAEKIVDYADAENIELII